MAVQTHKARWSVEIYEVTDHDHQQRILEAFLEIGRPHVLALGTQSGRRSYVIVEVASGSDKIFTRCTISAIDAHATRTYSSKMSPASGPLPA